MKRFFFLIIILLVTPNASNVLAEPQKDILDIASGAVLLSSSSQYSQTWASLLLLDGTTSTGWCSAEGKAFPNTFIIELSQQYKLNEFVIDNTNTQEGGNPGISARKFILYGSIASYQDGYKKIFEGEAEKGKRKVFSFKTPTQAQWLKFTVQSNWGDAKYTEIMELEAYGDNVNKTDTAKKVDGVYHTNYNLFQLKQQGNKVQGCYDHDNGKLSGTTNGRVIRFQWAEDGPQVGTAIMVLNSDRSFLNGLWYENGSYRGLWYGNLVTDGRKPRCKVQNIDDTLGESLDNTGRAILYGIYFEIDSATLKPESTETLHQVFKTIKTKPSLKLTIEGHTDAQGSDQHNQTLSQERAQSVLDWLIKNGIDPARLSAKGYGESRPVADNSRPDGRALNRRVEVSVPK
ncbi:MAG: OmpA family protein [Deltaproteobacteria bacterium]|nr:OmpA family protein [Deltaproteobacteria bacterium]MBW1984788.1 OmpA family protein [Deltaproteobacteria bacterium]MBW2180463.1 OmpA family protein [Deltaproteobacteria bacterium]